MRALVVLFVTVVAATLHIVFVRAWWRAAIAKRRSGLLLLLYLPLMATFLAPIFVLGTTAAWAFVEARPWHVWFVFSCMMLWLVSVLIVSFRYSQKYTRTNPKA